MGKLLLEKNLAKTDLNDIKTAGLYFQNLIANAALDRNYPVKDAGGLIVLKSAYDNTTQIFAAFTVHRVFIRFNTQDEGIQGYTKWYEFQFKQGG